jgi:hypothetical protein
MNEVSGKENSPLVFADVFARLESAQVSYVVVSGVAVVLHGYNRPVFDLDIVINPISDNANHSLQVLMMAGFVPTIPVPLYLLTVLRMFDQHEREIDVFMRYHIPFEELRSQAVSKPVGHVVASVASLDHLLRAKRITSRPHDLMDIEGLMALSQQTSPVVKSTEQSSV